MQKKTAILILNYNNYEDTINCIDSVEKYNSAPIKFIVIDNGSKRENVVGVLDAYLKDKFGDDYLQINEFSEVKKLPYVTFIVSKVNDGYASGNNKGLRMVYADDEIDKVMVLNNDVLFVEDIIPTLSEAIDSDDQIGIVSPLLYKKDMVDLDYNCARRCEGVWRTIERYLFYYVNPFGIKDKWNKKQQYLLDCPELRSTERFEIALPSGSCMLFRKKLFESIGGFDPHTFLYNEENILYKKLHVIGKTNWMFPKLKCIHLGASSTKHEVGYFMIKSSADSTCYYIENYTKANKIVKVLFRIFIYNVFLPMVKIQKKMKKDMKM